LYIGIIVLEKKEVKDEIAFCAKIYPFEKLRRLSFEINFPSFAYWNYSFIETGSKG